MARSEVYILGNFAYVTNQLDGQVMETRSMLEILQMREVNSIDYFDTQILRFKPALVFKMFRQLVNTKRLFYLGAQGNLKYLFPFIWILAKVSRVDFHYFVVGGWIAEFIKNLPVHRFMLRRISGMYCETESIVRKLSDWYGYKHAYWFPNFRIYDFEPNIVFRNENPLKLVSMSRVTKSKGYDIIFRMADYINKILPDNSVIIDFYGPMIKKDEVDFFEKLSKFDYIKYKGMLQPKEINATLAGYDVMLFPTYYSGEGFPGTILDSYISGIPVIASDWRYNAELILHGQTGFLFDLNQEEDFYKYILKLYYDRDLLYNLKLSAFEKSKDFDHNTIWDIIVRRTGLQAGWLA